MITDVDTVFKAVLENGIALSTPTLVAFGTNKEKVDPLLRFFIMTKPREREFVTVSFFRSDEIS